VTTSVNRELGLDDFIARTPTEYVELAVAANAQRAELAAIRGWLRDLMTASTFGSHALYTRQVERAYRQMFQQWATTGAPPPPPLRLLPQEDAVS
jgi:protein O-GlcNAc transferase